MTRKEKIKLLQQIKDGKLSLQSLQPPQTYIFIELTPGIYTLGEMKYTESEFQEFRKKEKEKNSKSIIWHEGKTYEDDPAIVFKLDPRYNYETQGNNEPQGKDQPFTENKSG